MRNDALWTLLLLSWMVGATYYYVCHIRKHCCGGCEAVSDMSMAELTATPSAALRVQGAEVPIASDRGIRFARNESFPVVASLADSALHQLTDYLQARPDQLLHITGWYDDSEKNNSLLASLGRARAEAVKQRLVGLGVPKRRWAPASARASTCCSAETPYLTDLPCGWWMTFLPRAWRPGPTP